MPILNLRDNPQLLDDTVDLYYSYLHDTWVPNFFCTLNMEEIKTIVSATLEKRDYLVVVAPDNKCQWLAYGEPCFEDSSVYETLGLYIKPDFRNAGIGSTLKEEQINVARSSGKYRWMYSKFHVSNEISKLLLERLGFQIFLSEDGEWYMWGLKLN